MLALKSKLITFLGTPREASHCVDELNIFRYGVNLSDIASKLTA